MRFKLLGCGALAACVSGAGAQTFDIQYFWDNDPTTVFVNGSPVTIGDGERLTFRVTMGDQFLSGNSDGMGLAVGGSIQQIGGPNLGGIQQNSVLIAFSDWPNNSGNPVDELNISWEFSDFRFARAQFDFDEDTVSIDNFNPQTGFTDGSIDAVIAQFQASIPAFLDAPVTGFGGQLGSLLFGVGPSGPDGSLHDACVADLSAPYGTLDFFDIAQFITIYNAGSPAADVAVPFGVLNVFDITAFIALYGSGCP